MEKKNMSFSFHNFVILVVHYRCMIFLLA